MPKSSSDADAHHLEPPQRHQRAFQVADERRFGDLQFEAPGSEARFDQNLMDHLGKVLIVDLNGRDIDRDGQGLRPARGLTAGGPQHPLSDLENDTRFFGNGNEFEGEASLCLLQRFLAGRARFGARRGA